MKILAIETSCDETAAAVVGDGTNVLSSVVASSQEMYAKYGGIIPEVAAREQVKAIIPVINEALGKAVGATKAKRADTSTFADSVDAIAITYGPGLIGSLLVGVETAKTLSWVWQKPLIKVNHLLAHIYASFLSGTAPKFPFLTLIVSGGHTDLLLMKSHEKYKWLGGTRDDAAGEAFDKAARLLNLGYPGGPAISSAAQDYLQLKKELPQEKIADLEQTTLPRSMIKSGNYDFSFSGLKTALRRELNFLNLSLPSAPSKSSLPEQVYLAYEVQESITDILISKTISAGKEFSISNIVLCGGVSANKVLREKLKEAADKEGLKVFVPDFKYSTDNAAMVGSRAFFAQDFVKPHLLHPDPSLLY